MLKLPILQRTIFSDIRLRQKFLSFGHLCLDKLPQEKNFAPCQKVKALNLETHPSIR